MQNTSKDQNAEYERLQTEGSERLKSFDSSCEELNEADSSFAEC